MRGAGRKLLRTSAETAGHSEGGVAFTGNKPRSECASPCERAHRGVSDCVGCECARQVDACVCVAVSMRLSVKAGEGVPVYVSVFECIQCVCP